MTDTIAELVAGRYRDPVTGAAISVPVRSVVIERSLDGAEAGLIRDLNLPKPYAVISDQNTYDALARKVEEALGPVIPIRLTGRPHCDERTAGRVMKEGAKAGTYIAVGSGTINDLAKFAAARQGKRCAVFATAPSMNGYTSENVAITIGGHKKSLPAMAPDGVFMDLGVLSAAPRRMLRAGLGDAICRSTAQCDWLMAHILRGSPYRETPFALFSDLEEELMTEAAALVSGHVEAVERLARVLVLSGFGMTICGGSYPASQGEHLISHVIEMTRHGVSDDLLHGEQIAVTTLVMARLQEHVLDGEAPVARPSILSKADVIRYFGEEAGQACWKEVEQKLLNREAAEAFSATLSAKWPELKERLASVMRPSESILRVLSSAGAPVSYRDLNLSREEFGSAVWHARHARNRYTFLDLAADTGKLVPERFMN